MIIPFSKVTMSPEEAEVVQRVLSSGWLAAGPETKAFEEEFADYVGVKHAIFTNSCTSALKMAYKYFNENRDKTELVFYPENTFCATYSAAEEMGTSAYPYEKMKEWGNNWNQDMVRVNVHFAGIKDETPCLIEDSAHRIEPNDPLVGEIRCYSFYATKNMTTGSGGMFVTNDDAIYERARLYWRDGLTTSTEDRSNGIVRYSVDAMAGGYDGNDIAAAIGRVQLAKLPQFTARRNDIKDYYNSALGQKWLGNHLYPYFVENEEAAYTMIAWMKEQGVSCGFHYPGTGWNGVSLPIYPLLTDTEAEYVVAKIKEYAARV